MNQKGFIKDLIIIVIGIIILAGGYFYFFKKPANAPVESNQISTNQNTTANWKTYINPNLPWKFSIRYPAGWGIFDGFKEGATYIQLFPDKDHKLEIALSATDGSLNEIVQEERSYYSERERVKYGESEWSFGIIKLEGGDGPSTGTAFAAYSVLNNVNIRAIGYFFPTPSNITNSNYKNLEPEYKTVISTFKFTK